MFGVRSLVKVTPVQLEGLDVQIVGEAVRRRLTQLKAEYVSVAGEARDCGPAPGWGGELKRREETYRAAIADHEALLGRLGGG